MKKILFVILSVSPFFQACTKKVDSKPKSVDVIYEIESNTLSRIDAHYGVFYHNASGTGSTMVDWKINQKGVFTNTSTYELGSVGAEGDAISASGEWVFRIKNRAGKILQEQHPKFYRNGGQEYYSVIMSVYPE